MAYGHVSNQLNYLVMRSDFAVRCYSYFATRMAYGDAGSSKLGISDCVWIIPGTTEAELELSDRYVDGRSTIDVI